MSTPRHSRIRRLVTRPEDFSRYAIGIPLRPYQQEVTDAILKSILGRLGLSFVVIFPRQSGKNEAQAHIQAYLLCLLSGQEVEIVSVSPTYKPQALNAMLRLQRCLDRNPFTCGRWCSQAGFTVRLDRACVHFFSGSSVAQTVGATASALLSVDEAQDIRPSTYDRKFAPMVASANATRVFWGTSWTSSTLLAREKRRAESDQARDGVRRLWTLTAEDVALVHPLYGEFVSGEVGRFGRTHPYIKTQYFSEEIDSQGSLFNPTRLALIFPGRGGIEPPFAKHPRGTAVSAPPGAEAGLLPSEMGLAGVRLVAAGQDSPSPYPIPNSAFLLDVAGMDESKTGLATSLTDEGLGNPGRDSTTLTVVGIDLSTLETLNHPAYRVLARHAWTGENHLAVFGKIKNLAEQWSPQYIVIDATGVGEGLWALLDRSFPTRVIPVKFTAQEKSEIGWRFLSIVETGRFSDPTPSDKVRLQYSHCISEILPGPAKTLRWGVPDGTRSPDGELLHDDYLLADSLTAILDRLEWHAQTEPRFVECHDPLLEMDCFDSSNGFPVTRF